MILDQGKTSVRTLRILSNEQDRLALQSRLVRALGNLDFCPQSLPATAILCIRRLPDPAPGRLSANGMSLREQSLWGEAARARVAEMVGRAARPVQSAVAANSEAVLFSDRAELLACLANDWCEGSIAARWWWQSLYGNSDTARVAVTAWREAPEHIPAALDSLARRQRALAFVRRLHDSDVRALQGALVRTFGLHELNSVFGRDVHMDAPPTTAANAEHGGSDLWARNRPIAGRSHQGVPWQRWAPESRAEGLDRDRRWLLGIGLSLQRAPAVVRSGSFAREVAAWYHASRSTDGDLGGTVLPVAESDSSTAETQSAALASGAGSSRAAQSADASLASPRERVDDPQWRPSISSAAQRPPSIATDIAPEPESGTIPPGTAISETRAEESQGPPSATQVHRDAHDTTPLSSKDDVQSPAVFEEQVETELGGLFYLINLGLYLNLYADFTRPLQPGIALPIWDFIALIGRRFLAGRFQDDPVWVLLARLAGRAEDELPGGHFEPPNEWRIPAQWLGPFAGHCTWTWSVDRERLRVRHPAGFCILDVRTGGDVRQRLRDETRVYAGSVDFELRAERRQRAHKAPPLERWLDWLLPFLSARLRRALGLDREDDLAQLLFSHRARIEATATRLDIHLALADLPIAIRLAGLDRDPGWVPAAGRFVAFHYQ